MQGPACRSRCPTARPRPTWRRTSGESSREHSADSAQASSEEEEGEEKEGELGPAPAAEGARELRDSPRARATAPAVAACVAATCKVG